MNIHDYLLNITDNASLTMQTNVVKGILCVFVIEESYLLRHVFQNDIHSFLLANT